MNLINAAESIVKAKADEFAFVMNTCVQDQQSENLEKFLNRVHPCLITNPNIKFHDN